MKELYRLKYCVIVLPPFNTLHRGYWDETETWVYIHFKAQGVFYLPLTIDSLSQGHAFKQLDTL